MTNLSQTITEFNKKYKYCFEELEKHYQECFTSDVKSNEWYKNYWLTKADTIDKVVRELKLCVRGAKYMTEFYKENKK